MKSLCSLTLVYNYYETALELVKSLTDNLDNMPHDQKHLLRVRVLHLMTEALKYTESQTKVMTFFQKVYKDGCPAMDIKASPKDFCQWVWMGVRGGHIGSYKLLPELMTRTSDDVDYIYAVYYLESAVKRHPELQSTLDQVLYFEPQVISSPQIYTSTQHIDERGPSPQSSPCA